MCLPLLTVNAFAAATGIDVSKASYYDNGDVKNLVVDFLWDTASAKSRLTVMTERLRSAGESGTDKYYGDFTDYGYYGWTFKNWDAVLAKNSDFGIIYYSAEQKINEGKSNTFSIAFDQGDIPLDEDETYYVYLWTYYNGYYYPDNLFMVLKVEDGKFQYAEATDRNDYGRFTTLKEAEPAPSTPSTPVPGTAIDFTDVADSDYFAEPVTWAVECGITNGTSTEPPMFSPDMTCSRAHILTFLWRAAGQPEPSISNSYKDVSSSDYFYKAALWAKQKGIYDGGSYFKPDTPCTRGSTVEYFWRYAWSVNVETVPFSDVKKGSDLEKAVSWAVDYGITNGTGGTTFSPDMICTRGQIVTFLYRFYVQPLDNSQLIEELKNPAPVVAPTEPVVLDPDPPTTLTKQPDWYSNLTHPSEMSNAKLVAEYDHICSLTEQDIYRTEVILTRENDLWSNLSQRCDKVKRYDRGMNNGGPSDWVIEDYEELIAAYGSADPIRNCILY